MAGDFQDLPILSSDSSATGGYRPGWYDAVDITYSTDGVSSAVYSLQGVDLQRLDLNYSGGILTSGTVKLLPSNVVIRTITFN